MISTMLVVDTDVVSFIHKKHSLANRYLPHLRQSTPAIAAQTIAELRFGAYLRNWGQRRIEVLETMMSNYLALYPNDAICTQWAEINVLSYKRGHPISLSDAWIAATARAFDVPLVTHNRKDFDFIPNLNVISEQA